MHIPNVGLHYTVHELRTVCDIVKHFALLFQREFTCTREENLSNKHLHLIFNILGNDSTIIMHYIHLLKLTSSANSITTFGLLDRELALSTSLPPTLLHVHVDRKRSKTTCKEAILSYTIIACNCALHRTCTHARVITLFQSYVSV